MAVRLTPAQKVGSSNLSALIFHVLAVVWQMRRPSSWCVQKSPPCPTMNSHILARLATRRTHVLVVVGVTFLRVKTRASGCSNYVVA